MLGWRRGRVLGAEPLARAFSPRSNSLAMMRLGLAGLVALAHGFWVGYGHQPELGGTHLADYAVDGFFVLSGFLVTRSYLRLDSFRRYAWHRFLRIMPGFWACLVVTAVVVAPVAAVLAGEPALRVFTTEEDPAWRYVLANSLLPILQEGIAGISAVAAEPGKSVFDGSLWTLAYEALCYVVVAFLGISAALKGRRWVVPALAALVWVVAAANHAGLVPFGLPLFDNASLLRFLLVFLLGAAACLYADRVPVHWALAAVSGAVVLGTAFLPDYRIMGGALAFAYLCVYAMVRLPMRYNPSWDLSYGVYIYHWPIQVLLALAGARALGEWPFVLLALVLALLAAAVSWYVVEGPALRLKDAAWVTAGRTGPAPDAAGAPADRIPASGGESR